MAYTRMGDFLRDFLPARKLATEKFGKGGFYKDVDQEAAWNAYVNAKQKTDPGKGALGLMLFGRHIGSVRQEVAKRARARKEEIYGDDERLRRKRFVSKATREHRMKGAEAAVDALAKIEMWRPSIETDSDLSMIKNFGVVNNEKSGSILLMGSENWSFTVNDCWVVGAVHSHLPFYPASEVSKANIYDDKYILSITGRELYGLALFGYRHVIPGHSEAAGSYFEVRHPHRADGATLASYQQAINNLTREGAEQTFKDAGFRISDVGF